MGKVAERASDCLSPSGRQRLAAAAEARRVRRGAAPAIAEHAGRRGRVGSGLGPRRGERGGPWRSRLHERGETRAEGGGGWGRGRRALAARHHALLRPVASKQLFMGLLEKRALA